MNDTYDVVVIGGGPAGSASAMYARRAGLSVCVVERHGFPRETLCGEFLSHEVMEVLDELGLAQEFLFLEPNPIHQFVLVSRGGAPVRIPLGFRAYGLTRGRFDAFLLTAAQRAGSDLFQPAIASAIDRDPAGGFIVTCTLHGEPLTLKCRQAVEATGKSPARSNGRSATIGRSETRFAAAKFHISASHLKGIASDEIVMILGDGIYCGINMVDQGIGTICCLDRRPPQAPPIRERIQRLAETNDAVQRMLPREALDALHDAPVYGAGNLAFGEQGDDGSGVVRIGDSAGMIAPLAGDGIAMALQAARLFGERLGESGRTFVDNGQFAHEYRTQWRKLFSRRLHVASICQRVALSPLFGRLVDPLISLSPSLLKSVISITRG